jgi:hypothetical protein
MSAQSLTVATDTVWGASGYWLDPTIPNITVPIVGGLGRLAGIVSPPDWVGPELHPVFNVSGVPFTVLHNAPLISGAAIQCPDGRNLVVHHLDSFMLWRDADSSCWRAMATGSRYESAVWTPSLRSDGDPAGFQYADRAAWYSRHDDLVHVEARIRLTAKGAPGQITIAGLPYPAAQTPAAPLDYIAGFVGITGALTVLAVGSVLYVAMHGGATARTLLTTDHLTDASDMGFGLTYRISG